MCKNCKVLFIVFHLMFGMRSDVGNTKREKRAHIGHSCFAIKKWRGAVRILLLTSIEVQIPKKEKQPKMNTKQKLERQESRERKKQRRGTLEKRICE